MHIILGIIIALFNYWLLCRNEEKGIILYCILLVVCPVSIIGEVSIYYSYISLPFLAFWYIQHPKRQYRAAKFVIPLIIIVFWDFIATVYALSIGISSEVNYFGFTGLIRNIIILIILAKQKAIKERFLIILGAVLIINCIVQTIELFLLQIWSYDMVVNVWRQLYGTMGNTGSMDHLIEYGAVGRLQGTFSSSAFTATLSVIGIGCFLMRYFERKQWVDIIMVVASLYCGLGSASKRFFLGGVLIVIVCIILRSFWKRKNERSFDYKFPVFVMVVIISLSVLYTFLNEYLTLDYYLDYLIKGNLSGSMESRFGKEEGVVNSMLPYIREYWLIGLGEISIKGVLVTDSEFYVTLFKLGVVGIVCYIFFWGKLFRKVMIQKEGYVAIVLIWSIFEFVISTEFSTNLGVLLLGFVLASICCHKDLKIYLNGK